jgi:Ca2+-binding RTX toxin-like protein
MIGLENLTGFGAGIKISADQLDSFTGVISVGERSVAIGTPAIQIIDGGTINLLDAKVYSSTINLSDFGNNLSLNSDGATTFFIKGGESSDHIVISGTTTAIVRAGGGDDVVVCGDGTDTVYGDLGKDSVHMGAGDDYVQIRSLSDLTAGEIYDGGDGIDYFYCITSGHADLSDIDLTGFERFEGMYVGGATMTPEQLNQFDLIYTGSVTIKGSGAVDLSHADMLPETFNLSNDGNSIIVSNYDVRTINGGSSADTVTIVGLAGGVTINGNGGDDSLYGSNPDDILNGGDGLDLLQGGGGKDTLTGGAGADQFVFKNINNGPDTITDFSGQTAFAGGAGEHDVLRFEGVLHGTFEYRGAQAFTASGHTEARVLHDHVLVDTDGNGTSDITIALTGLTSASQLSAADFLFA